MNCAGDTGCCFDVAFEEISPEMSVTFTRFCETLVDLVAFATTKGRYLTSNGYTILVKKS